VDGDLHPGAVLFRRLHYNVLDEQAEQLTPLIVRSRLVEQLEILQVFPDAHGVDGLARLLLDLAPERVALGR